MPRSKSKETPITEQAEYSYDAIPYGGYPRTETHPDVLATRAAIFGLNPAPIDKARVLEIGCGDGGNLISIAASLPGSECYGIDLSAKQIKIGQARVKSLGLKNIKLEQKDAQDLSARPKKKWDYIICHGVFSWVTPEVQNSLLELIRLYLAPEGVAYLSYNCFPGWHLRGITRDLMRFHAESVDDSAEKVTASREIVDSVIRSIPDYLPGYAGFLQDEQNLLNQSQDFYIAHEHLEEENHPLYFKDAWRMFEGKKLQYLCEASLSSMFINRFPGVLGQCFRKEPGLDDIEQYLDFVQLRMFRQTLLCHADAKIERSLDPVRVRSMHAAAFGVYEQGAAAITGEPETFQGPRGANLTTGQPIAKAALQVLAGNWPRRIPFDELVSLSEARLAETDLFDPDKDKPSPPHDEVIAETLLAGCTAEILDLHISPGAFVCEVSDKPAASPLARLQAAEGERVSTLRHTVLNPDQLTRHLLKLLDGKTDRSALIEAISGLAEEEGIGFEENGLLVTEPNRIRELIELQVAGKLEEIARAALLTG